MNNQEKKLIEIAIIGDVHDQWEPEDEMALKNLGVDLLLFVGDFGNESVDIVRQIAQVDLPKAVVLGNHDAWYSASQWGRLRSPYNHNQEDRLQQQLDLLKEVHVGYGFLDFPQFNLSVVGGRPFSWGGPDWKNSDFYHHRFGVHNFTESTEKIIDAVNQTAYETIIFLAHNGPHGLGEKPEDPCGKDWQPLGGDFGDPDLTSAIARSRTMNKKIPLVTFGHMHHNLRHTKRRLRKMVYAGSDGSIYYNSAVVPRLMETKQGKLRNFSLVSLRDGIVEAISLVWLTANFQLVSQDILYSSSEKVVFNP